jgi:hypothetical protein
VLFAHTRSAFLVVFLPDPVIGPSHVPLFQQASVTAPDIAQNPLFNDGAPFGSPATPVSFPEQSESERPVEPSVVLNRRGPVAPSPTLERS